MPSLLIEIKNEKKVNSKISSIQSGLPKVYYYDVNDFCYRSYIHNRYQYSIRELKIKTNLADNPAFSE